MEYVPESPWIIGEDVSLETEMFYNYRRLRRKWWSLNKKEKKSKLFERLDWLMGKAEKADSKRKCPHCGKRNANYFGLAVLLRRDEYQVDGRYVTCENGGCARMIRAAVFASRVWFFKFSFKNLARIKGKFGANGEIIRLYASAFGLSSVTPYETFRFFKEL